MCQCLALCLCAQLPSLPRCFYHIIQIPLPVGSLSTCHWQVSILAFGHIPTPWCTMFCGLFFLLPALPPHCFDCIVQIPLPVYSLPQVSIPGFGCIPTPQCTTFVFYFFPTHAILAIPFDHVFLYLLYGSRHVGALYLIYCLFVPY